MQVMNLAATRPSTDPSRGRPDPTVRLRPGATASFAMCVLALGLTLVGLLPLFDVGVVTAYCVAGYIVFFWLLRSGRTARFRDPSCAFASHLFLVSIPLLGSVLIPQDRSAALQLFLLIWAFDVPHLSQRQLTASALIAIFGELAIILATASGDPDTLAGLLRALVVAILSLPALVAIGHAVRKGRRQQFDQRTALAEALAKLQSLSERDALTGASNRRHVLDVLAKEIARQNRSGLPFSVGMLDIDHFKRINDAHGHAVGDQVLIGVASRLGDTLPGPCTVARWGGEEFLVVMPETCSATAADWMRRSRLHLATQDWSDCAPGLRVDMSVGVCEHLANDPVATTLERADKALYQAKAEGRGRVVEQSD